MVEQRSGYVIATDDPGHPGQTLFMVNRSKQKSSFWSNRLTDVMIYQNQLSAVAKAASLAHNNPRALDWDEARAALRSNMSLSVK